MARYKGNKSKIYYSLDESIYTYETNNFIFYFSSVFYLERYTEQRKKYNVDFNNKQGSRFNIDMDLSDLADILHYKNRETRGFRVYDKKREVNISCLKNLTFVGEIKTLNN